MSADQVLADERDEALCVRPVSGMLTFSMSPRQCAIIISALRAFHADALAADRVTMINTTARGIGEDDSIAAEAEALAEMMIEAEPGATNALCV